MIHKQEKGRKGRIYASIIGLVLAANILLGALIVAINYPTEAHRTTARQLSELSMTMINGTDFTKVMETEEYKKLTTSPETEYTNTASGYTLVFNAIASVAIIGSVYYYLRKRRITTKVVGVTVLLVSVGQLLPLVLTQYGTVWFLGMQMPGIGPMAFMLFIGIVIAPLVIAVITRIFDWHYNRKHSFVID